MRVEDTMGSSLTTFVHDIRDSEHWLSPNRLMDEVGILAGMTAGEIGAGIAYYTLPIGERVGPDGRVFAVEWRPWLIDQLRDRLSGPGAPANVDLVIGRPAETHLAAGSCDLVILADIWHELENREAALDECRRILRPQGRLVLLDWRADGICPPGPPIEHRVSLRSTLCGVEMKSWALVHTATIGTDGYLLVFEMADESVQS